MSRIFESQRLLVGDTRTKRIYWYLAIFIESTSKGLSTVMKMRNVSRVQEIFSRICRPRQSSDADLSSCARHFPSFLAFEL